MSNYLETKVTVLLWGHNPKTNKDYYKPEDKRSMTLGQLLRSGDSRHLITECRKATDKAVRQNIKKRIVSYTPSGYYKDGKRTKNVAPLFQTGLVQVDIDGKHNPRDNWVTFRDYMFNAYPWIAVAALSCGGQGLYLLVNTTGFDNYDGHYHALVKLLADREDIIVDAAVGSSNEVRFLSLPEDCLIRDNAKVFDSIAKKPKNEYDNIITEGDGKLVEVPESMRGKMQRENVLKFISKNVHNGVPIDQVKIYLTKHCEDYMSNDSHMYGDAEAYCALVDDIYNRYHEQFNQAVETSKKAKLSGTRSEPRVPGVKTSHPAENPDRDKAMRDNEKLDACIAWVESRVSYDVIGDQYINDSGVTNPAREYKLYNAEADQLTYIEKHFFVTAFETGDISKINSLKIWGDGLPEWDGKDHIKKLITYVPAKDLRTAELFIKAWLIKAFIQAVNPAGADLMAVVNRWFLILHQHKQETGKSTFLQWLCPNLNWVKLSGIEESKDGYSALAKYMFVLDDELNGLGNFRFHERLKSMVSTSKIDVRPPYAKNDVSFARSASFCGSTNNDKIFPATEGNTRFLVVPLRDEAFNWREYTKVIDKSQVWAQVKALSLTDWLYVNENVISNTRSIINADLLKDNLESSLVLKYVKPSSDNAIKQVIDIVEELRQVTDDKLNMTLLGQALTSSFGARVNGYTKSGERRKGYKVLVIPTQNTTHGRGSESFDRVARLGVFIKYRPNR